MTKQTRGLSHSAQTANGKGRVKLDRDVLLKIGDGLRAMYDDIVQQGVPDRFTELLAKFDVKNDENSSSEAK